MAQARPAPAAQLKFSQAVLLLSAAHPDRATQPD
eukprot:CAMPEP_0196653758 /NCGR_PEP_ID=MMETSP1086-20130531/3408_1 /TAXON_ID=77921 /ORGANISM="Cyanoptyche  gloeocystis , Strain SAG4.97" /LENGTH=33 /DNA_ID= /DNA_START= /DNA_END= /DNA_ORIENTATION=